MPRNGSGSFSLAEPAFVPNTAISSAAMNSDLSDIGDALTGSLARDGQGGMTAVLPLANNGFTYLTDPNTGIRRTAADTQAIQCGGVDVVTTTPTGVTVAGTLAVSGAITSGGAPLIPIGAGMLWFGSTAPAKWIFAIGQTLLRATYPDLWTFAAAEIAAGSLLFTNGNGTTTFTIANMKGRIPANRDDTGTILTSATVTPDGNVMGAIGGGQSSQLSTANLPPYTPSGTVSTPTISASNGNVVTTNAAINNVQPQGGGGAGQSPFSASTSFFAAALPSTQPTFTGAAQGGTSTSFSNVQPTIITNYIIYAGA
jgi:microcystin-dependent protein